MVTIKDYRTVDASSYPVTDTYIRMSLLFSTIGQQPLKVIHIDGGLQSVHVMLIQAFAQATEAKITDVREGSNTFTFVPSHEFRAKKIVLHLDSDYSLLDVLTLFIYPALLTGKRMVLQLKGMTHMSKKPSIAFAKEELLRYLHKYLQQHSFIQLSYGFAPDDVTGEIEVTVQGKYSLAEFPPFKPYLYRQLVAVRGDLLVGKDVSSELVERVVQLLHLSLGQTGIHYRLDEQSIATTKGIALQMFGYFGTDSGFDNDFPFVVGKDILWTSSSELSSDQLEQDVFKFIREFREILSIPAFDKYIGVHILPLLFLAGGEIPVQELTDEVLATLGVASIVLDSRYAIEKNIITAEKYDGIAEQDVIRIEDL